MPANFQVNYPPWVAGWHLNGTVAAVTILGGLAGGPPSEPYLFGFVAFFFLAPIIALIGLRYVNGNYGTVLNEFHSQCRQKAEELISLDDDNVETYLLRSGTGSKLFRKPSTNYSTVTIIVTDYSLIIHDGNTLDMMWLSATISDSTEEIHYDQISGVNFEPTEADDEEGEFSVNRSDGEGNSWETDWKPENALDDIQQRVRDYERRAAKQ